MKNVIICKGLPGSGKSTWAKAQVDKYPGRYKRINKDDLRSMLDNSKWSKNNEKFILKVRDMLILQALEDGFHVIVDDTNLVLKHYTHIKRICKDCTITIKDFTDVPLETCIKRDLKRHNSVGKDVIMDMYNKHIKLDNDPLIERDPDLKDVIICDLDGTLCLMQDRSPFEFKKCITDKLNSPVSEVLHKFNDTPVIFFSGRSDIAKEETIQWLNENGHSNYLLLSMRKEGDYRKDDIVKEEMFNKHVKGKYNVKFVLDDRDQVVNKWREIGLNCFQVAEGNF